MTQKDVSFTRMILAAALMMAFASLTPAADDSTQTTNPFLDNAVFAVPYAGTTNEDQGTGSIIYQDEKHLHGALAMTLAPNGDLLVSNNDVINGDPNQPSEIVEFTTGGQFVKELSVDPNQGGSFGLSVQTGKTTSQFAAVDDNQSNISIWTLSN